MCAFAFARRSLLAALVEARSFLSCFLSAPPPKGARHTPHTRPRTKRWLEICLRVGRRAGEGSETSWPCGRDDRGVPYRRTMRNRPYPVLKCSSWSFLIRGQSPVASWSFLIGFVAFYVSGERAELRASDGEL